MSAIRCEDIAEIDKSNLVISVLIAIGIVGSYVPQHLRIYRRGSSEGLSPFFLLLGVTSCTNSLVNITVLQWNVLRCCASLSAPVCVVNSLGVVQLLLQWTMFSTTLVLYLVYFSRPSYFPHQEGGSGGAVVPVARLVPRRTLVAWNVAVVVSLVAIVHLFTFIGISLSFLRRSATREKAITWANWVGGSAMILSGLQYLPQILTTTKRGTVGSLSIWTLILQAPGSFLFAYSIAQRPGVRWSSWLLFVVTGTLQTLLLSICLYFSIRHKYHWGERTQIRREQAQRDYDVIEDERVGLLEEQTGDESEDEADIVRRTHEEDYQ